MVKRYFPRAVQRSHNNHIYPIMNNPRHNWRGTTLFIKSEENNNYNSNQQTRWQHSTALTGHVAVAGRLIAVIWQYARALDTARIRKISINDSRKKIQQKPSELLIARVLATNGMDLWVVWRQLLCLFWEFWLFFLYRERRLAIYIAYDRP